MLEQKVHPIGFRLGITKQHTSNWYAEKSLYTENLLKDIEVREYLSSKLAHASVSRIEIDRTADNARVNIHTARPGIIIGKGGQEVETLKEELKKLTKKDVQVNIFEVKRPELEATLVANGIARQIEGRISYKRAIKMSIASTMRMGSEGIKVQISGRLNGAEMARSEMFKDGRTPLHTFRADIDYALAEAQTTYGKIGVKVWICRGEIYGKRDLMLHFKSGKSKKGNDRRQRRR